MKSKKVGKPISAIKSNIEVSAITKNGLWLLVESAEYFLDYEEYPWFKGARTDFIFNVKLLKGGHLHWPDLDVDLMVDGLANRDLYPLVAKPVKSRA